MEEAAGGLEALVPPPRCRIVGGCFTEAWGDPSMVGTDKAENVGCTVTGMGIFYPRWVWLNLTCMATPIF